MKTEQLAPGGHDPIVVLESEMIRQRGLADSPSTDAATDEHAGKCFELIREIADTRPGTSAGRFLTLTASVARSSACAERPLERRGTPLLGHGID